MTVAEILEQVKALNPQEQAELKKLLNTMPDSADADAPYDPSEHWGKNLLQLLDEIGPIELVDPEIEDPVEWVKAQRKKEADRLKPYWGDVLETEDSAE